MKCFIDLELSTIISTRQVNRTISSSTLATMSEETVECFYYSEKQEDWESLCSDINKVITQKSKDYIWHKDELKLVLPVKGIKLLLSF